MIYRKGKILNGKDEIAFQFSLTIADVKRILQQYVTMLTNCDFQPEETEVNLRYWLLHEPSAFAIFPTKYAEQLSTWCIAVGLRHGFLNRSAASDTTFIFNPILLKKKGRPKES